MNERPVLLTVDSLAGVIKEARQQALHDAADEVLKNYMPAKYVTKSYLEQYNMTIETLAERIRNLDE
jgi:hypothetical protein